MIRPIRIKTALYGGVGFRQSLQTEYLQPDEYNAASISGLYFDDASGFCTVENIYDVQPKAQINSTEFNTILTNLQKSAILDVCNKVVEKEDSLLWESNLFPYQKIFKNKINTSNRFVGFEINPMNFKDTIGKVSFIELCFDTDITLPIYLYNSNSKTEIYKEEIDCKADESTILQLDWFIENTDLFKGGKYYLGYYESDLNGAQAYKKDYEDGNLMIENMLYQIYPISLTPTVDFIDIETKVYQSETFGINFGLSVYKDYTEKIVNSKELFWTAIQLMMCEKVLNMIKYTTRSSFKERLNKDFVDQINFDLYGNKNLGIEGIEGKLESELKSLKKALFFKPLIIKGTLR